MNKFGHAIVLSCRADCKTECCNINWRATVSYCDDRKPLTFAGTYQVIPYTGGRDEGIVLFLAEYTKDMGLWYKFNNLVYVVKLPKFS